MRIGSLFSGAAGLDRAVQAVFGGDIVWHSEIDKAASKVLAYRFPGVPNLGDITKIDWAAVEPVDIICGGWPCQPFSLAGKQKGIHDERALWPHVARAVRVLRPRYVVLENVSAVLTAGEFDRVAADLAACGYDIRWTCARASDVGAAHRRERLFIVADSPRNGRHKGRPESARLVGGFDAAVSGDEPGVALLPTPQAFDQVDYVRTPEQLAEQAQRPNGGGARNLREAIVNELPEPTLLSTPQARDFKGVPADNFNNAGTKRQVPLTDLPDLLPTPTSRDHKGGNQRGDETCLHGALLPTSASVDGQRGPDFARVNRDHSGGDDLVTLAVKAEMASAWGKYAPAIARWEQVTGVPAPAPTEPNRNGNPRLNPEFSSWMMGWPAGWVTDPAIGISRNDQLRIVGNGVVSRCAEVAIRYLLQVAEVGA